MFGRVGRKLEAWNLRVQFAELFNALVLTDLKQAAAFPTNHRLHPIAPSVFPTPQTSQAIQSADLIISFDWVDLAGTLKSAYPASEPKAEIVHVSLDSSLHTGWSKDHFDLPPVDISVQSDPDKFLYALFDHCKSKILQRESDWTPIEAPSPKPSPSTEDIFMGDLAAALYSAIPESDLCLVRIPLGWRGSDLVCTQPLSFLGQDGGAGLASGPGQAVGAALALKAQSSELIPVAVLGDGDFFMGSTALWTAARYRLPVLVIVANNASFFNDEVHQERVAKTRGRPVENKWIGMRLDDPNPDVSKNAESLGAKLVNEGQVKQRSQLEEVLSKAVAEVRNGALVVVDVKVLPEGYSSALEKSN